MDFISTRGKEVVSPSFAVLKGIADDGGLYVPSCFPSISLDYIEKLYTLPYYQRAAEIISLYLTDFDKPELELLCKKAYSKFDGNPAPLVRVEDDTYVLELFHGPTLAFKDIALTLLPFLTKKARSMAGAATKTLILVATSGDTGKAALEGFKNVEDTEIIVLYPSEGVSDMQKLQMLTTSGENVHVIGIEGNFDDAQSAVKFIFNDKDSIDKLQAMGYTLGSANSINFGRLVPQIVYYFSAYADLAAAAEITLGDTVDFVVPTGNFGNILAGFYAKKMGLPIDRLIVASNMNNVLTDFFMDGEYDINRKFYKTISPSMDILISSNLERLLFEVLERDSSLINELMHNLKSFGSYTIDNNTLERLSKDFLAYWSDEEQTKEAINNFFDTYEYLLDPHTAVAASALTECVNQTKTIILATASPYKFSSDVLDALGYKKSENPFVMAKKLESLSGIPVPEKIMELMNLEPIHNTVVAKEDIKKAILDILRS